MYVIAFQLLTYRCVFVTLGSTLAFSSAFLARLLQRTWKASVCYKAHWGHLYVLLTGAGYVWAWQHYSTLISMLHIIILHVATYSSVQQLRVHLFLRLGTPAKGVWCADIHACTWQCSSQIFQMCLMQMSL